MSKCLLYMYLFIQILNRLYKLKFQLFPFSILNFKELQPFISLCFLLRNTFQVIGFKQINFLTRSELKIVFVFCLDFLLLFLALFLSLLAFFSEELYQNISSLALLARSQIHVSSWSFFFFFCFLLRFLSLRLLL